MYWMMHGFRIVTSRILKKTCTHIGGGVHRGFCRSGAAREALLSRGRGVGTSGLIVVGLVVTSLALGEPVFSFLERETKLGARDVGGNP
jgi:hypothetical protein